MNVLVANAGSSSLKLRVVDEAETVLASGDQLEAFLADAPRFAAVGHRVVHGGGHFSEPVVIDERVIADLRGAGELAPLHNAPALDVVERLRELCPDVPHVAAFDTAFHASMPTAAALYALPREWLDRFALRRLGFHGLSHQWASWRGAQMLGRPVEELRLVTCHLGAGASLAAVEHGRSVDTTMGFTPNEGLVMATRSGSVDPGLILWLIRHGGIEADALDDALERESGLAGLSGTSGDMREVEQAAGRGDQAARDALAVYLHRLRAGIAAMATAMDGADAVLFTGGVGEGSQLVRRETCRGLSFMGVALDQARNRMEGPEDRDLSAPGATVRALLVRSREEITIARAVREKLGDPAARTGRLAG